MCGIAGFLDFSGISPPEVLDRMTDSLVHRGPDARGTYLTSVGKALVGLGHRRLSILDLSDAGTQPMHRGELSVVFNGEIYNFGEIREELVSLGHQFRSHSDTEVILASYQQWGLSAAVKKFNGMFAFALLDASQQKFHLVRDRVGVKPLYVYCNDSVVLFASELKAFVEHPAFCKLICDQALTNYFRFGYIPAGQCIYRNTRQVQPSHIISVDLRTNNQIDHSYWHPEDLFSQPQIDLDYRDAARLLKEQLTKAFEYRMVSDVEVGVFLSGGIDSSTVAAILQGKPGRKLRTFTIGFQDSDFDESQDAARIAKHIGSVHTELVCDAQQAQGVIPLLPDIYDEPFGDASAIPTVLVSQLAREHVKVALSADGGDELFGGYNRYANWLEMEAKAKRIPSFLARSIPVAAMRSAFGPSFPGVGTLEFYSMYHNPSIGIEEKAVRQLCIAGEDLLHDLLGLHYRRWGGLASDCELPKYSSTGSVVRQMMQTDYLMYLPGDILTKVDRATMSVSLEGREPLLDYRLAELAFAMPLAWKIDGNQRKKIFKEIAFSCIPRELLDRPKKGFSVPYYRWLKTDLKYLIDEHLSAKALRRHQILETKSVEGIVRRFLSDDRRVNVMTWNLLMFQMWCDRWM